MHSLFVRIFVLFWIAMALIVGGSIAITFSVAARENESTEAMRRTNVAIQASEVLSTGGIGALKDWLNANKNAVPDRDLYIIGPDGRDILGRRLSGSAVRRLEFFNREREPSPPMNFRPPRFAPQIVGPDGSTYTVLQVVRHPSIFGALSLAGHLAHHSRGRAGGERLCQLVARAALERPDPPDSRRGAGVGLGNAGPARRRTQGQRGSGRPQG